MIPTCDECAEVIAAGIVPEGAHCIGCGDPASVEVGFKAYACADCAPLAELRGLDGSPWRGWRIRPPNPRPCAGCGTPTESWGSLCDRCEPLARREGIWTLRGSPGVAEGLFRCRGCGELQRIAQLVQSETGRLGWCSDFRCPSSFS